MDAPEIITGLVAIYGAGLSTLIFFQRRKEKKRQISISIAGEYRPWLGNKQFESNVLLFTITNPGDRTVTIYPPWIRLSKRKGMINPLPHSNITFPYELKEGKDCPVWWEVKDVKHNLEKMGYSGKVKLRAEIKDATGKVYKAKKRWKFDLEKDSD